MKVGFQGTCKNCEKSMVLGDTTDWDDTWYCEKCKCCVEVKKREHPVKIGSPKILEKNYTTREIIQPVTELPEQNGEREISSFSLKESIDYVVKAFGDGSYQDPYKDYLTEVMNHIWNIFPEPVEKETIPKDYIKWKKEQAGKAMTASTFNGQIYEFYKGQFLVLREILQPEYSKNINFELLDKWKKEWEEDEKKHWFEQKQSCGNCREEMVLNHGSNNSKEEIKGFRCPRCDSEVQITIPHEKAKTPRWKRSEK